MNTIVDASAPKGKRSFATKNYLPGEPIPAEESIRHFTQMTLFAHSCAGNCHYIPIATGMQCRAIRPIAAGDELTIAYNAELNLKPTYHRREEYFRQYGFTCHCPRCDAPGDDTRLFDCFDPVCKGVMMVCQPISKSKAGLPELKYTGVEYVEPHLLPCTECHQAAPAAYQKSQLVLEAVLPTLIQKFAREEHDLVVKAQTGFVPGMALYSQRLQQKIESHKLPMRHALCLPVHQMLLRLAPSHMGGIIMQDECEIVCRYHREKASRAYVAALEGLTHGPSEELLDVLKDEIVYENVILGSKVVMGITCLPEDAKKLLQHTLRVQMVLKGRDACAKGCTCRDDLDTYLLKTLQQLPAPQEVLDAEVCAFCEESPTSAFMKRSRCGACKKVMYCSAGCQKAHWKLHKKTCAV